MEYSVLMSVYSKENPIFFKGAINSMLCQTVMPSDFVIVCDGPLNSELDRVIDDYCHEHPVLFNILRLKENQGLAKALNAGIVHCKYECVARMDSDDIAMPDRMEKQLKAMKEQKADIVSGTVWEFSGMATNVKEVEKEGNFGKKRVLPQYHQQIKEFARKRNPFNHPTVVYKKSAVRSVGMYEDYRYFEDYNLWVAMIMAGCRGYNVEEPVLYMRAGSGMYKRRGGIKYVSYIFKFKKHLREIKFISFGEYLIGCLGHAAVSLMPTGLRKAVYEKLLRKNK